MATESSQPIAHGARRRPIEVSDWEISLALTPPRGADGRYGLGAFLLILFGIILLAVEALVSIGAPPLLFLTRDAWLRDIAIFISLVSIGYTSYALMKAQRRAYRNAVQRLEIELRLDASRRESP